MKQNKFVTLMEIPTKLVLVVLELISKHSVNNLTTDRNKIPNTSTDIQ